MTNYYMKLARESSLKNIRCENDLYLDRDWLCYVTEKSTGKIVIYEVYREVSFKKAVDLARSKYGDKWFKDYLWIEVY